MADTNGLVSFLNSLGQQADDSRTAKTLQNYAASTMYGGNGAAPQQPGVLSQILGNVTQPAAAAVSDSGLGNVPVAGQTLTSLLNSFGASRGADASQQPAPQTSALSSVPVIGGVLDRLLDRQQPQNNLPSSSSPQSGPVNPTPPPQQQASASSTQPGTLNQNLAGILANRNQAYNLPPGYLAQTAMIESGGDPNVGSSPTGAKGLFQFTGATAKQYGLTDPSNPIQSADAAGRLAADNAKALTQALGRPPTAGELYLAHQQGAAGAAALIKNPNAPAGQVLASIGADPNAITVNGGDPNAPAGAFVGKWASRFDNNGSGQPTGMAYSGAQPQAPAQAAIQGATTGQPQVASSDEGTDTPTTGRSASPITAGVQTNMLSLGTPSPSRLPPQEALNGLLADPGTRELGISILKAYQAKQLGPTYTLTNIPGVGWVQRNSDTGQATLLKGDDVMSPEALAQKLQITKAGKEKDDSYDSKVIGEDAYGNKQYGVLNKSTGAISPVNSQAQPSQNQQQNVSDLHGADFLATLDPGIAGQVKAIADGRAQYPTGNLLRSPIGQRLAQAVQQYDPTFDASNSGARAKMVNNLSLATPSSLGGQINTGNTAIGHLADLSNAIVDLGNVDLGNTWLTHTANSVRGWSTDQAAKINALQDAAQHYGQEITKFYAGSPGGEQERQSFLLKLDAAKSPQELAGVIATEAELMPARLSSIDSQIQGTLGPQLAAKYPVIRPESQKALATINANLARLRGIAPASDGASPNAAAGASSSAQGISEGSTATNPRTGQRIIFTNGSWQVLK